jgi:hypothetical protein
VFSVAAEPLPVVQQRTPAVRKANKETANAAAKVAAAAAAAAVTTTAAATAAAVPLGRSPGGDALIDSRMFARNVTVRARKHRRHRRLCVWMHVARTQGSVCSYGFCWNVTFRRVYTIAI